MAARLTALADLPFTPFHFGPGLLAKGASPRHVSFTAFVASQVAVDCEPLYHYLRNEYPLHGAFHTVLGGGLVGLATGAAVWAVGLPLADRLPALLRRDITRGAALTGGLIGGVSHALIDGLVHRDMRPLWPVAGTTWVLPPLGIAAVPLACVMAGVLGASLWLVRRERA